MGLVSWVFGNKPKASEQASSTTTPGDKPDGEVKAYSKKASPETNTSSRDDQFTIEELDGDDGTLDAEVESGHENPDPEARSSNSVQVKRSASTKSARSSRFSSTAELFGGDDTDFLTDFLEEAPVPLKFQRPTETLPENNKDAVSPGIDKNGNEDGAYDGDVSEQDEEADGDIASPRSSDLEANTSEQSALSKSTKSGEDNQAIAPTDEDQSDAHEDEQEEQQGVAAEQETLTEEQVAIVKVPSTDADQARLRKPIFTCNWGDSDEDEGDWPSLHVEDKIAIVKEPSTKIRLPKPVIKTSWADLDDDDDDDDWTIPVGWTADKDGENGPIDQTFQGAERGSEAGTLASRYGAGHSGLDKGGDVAKSDLNQAGEKPKKIGTRVRGSKFGTVASKYPSSPLDCGAGYTGPSRSLAFHQYATVEQAYRYEEIRRDADEAYQIQMQKLRERYAAEIEFFKEPSTIAPDEEDLHDDEMRKVFSDIYPALPSQEAHGKMHIIDWKTLMGPDYMGPDPDDEEKYLLHFVKPRLCDAVATLLFESDPFSLDAWLDPSKKVVEWWHSPHYLHRGVMRTVIRRDGNDVIVGTFTDLGFNVCWSQYIKAEIDDDGQWTETYAFQGGQFMKKPGEKEPGASSRKIRGEIDWESFEIGEFKYYDEDELCDPIETLWHGRVLAHTMLRMILDNYSQYRGGNTVELVIDGKLTSIEQRGIRRVPRINGIENDRIEEVVSSLGLFAPFEEDVLSLEFSSKKLNEVELEPMTC
ncbi:hypothetical protein P171DRAFT_514206 [Karstenula rhodostoma CBS 690.94]|uniref:Uncharacterized protein n=1 Tax=Karstenula rhodostoma CBS 690.94 TaxID=1392251 RepID=A0A9P4PJD5_9PLEO|nr:hypothetical protein P171DRAFT_514206 [Karstenula rhodostoma CBS 690.94]